MSKITFDDKVSLRESTLDDKYQLTTANINEIKTAINENYDENRFRTLVVTLNKAEINSISTTPISIPLADFGCEAGEFVKFLPELCEFVVSPDGTPFASPSRFGIRFLSDSKVIMETEDVSLQETVETKFLQMLNSRPYPAKDNPIIISSPSDITGGGASSFVEFTLFYKIITI